MAEHGSANEHPVDVPERMEVCWLTNQRGHGVVAFHPVSRIVIFPSRDHLPALGKVAEAGATMRTQQPESGKTEMCVVIRPEGQGVAFAYPDGGLVVVEQYGFHHVIGHDGRAELAVIPNWLANEVTARLDGDGDFVITVKRPK
jgi:hypothetical protein